jgi:hypothetical protein
MTRVLRLCLGLALGAAMLVSAAGPVAAAKPDRSPTESDDFTLSGFCGVDILVETLANNAHDTTFFDRDGNPTRSETNGRLVIRMTNVETGTSITLNIPGPGRFVEDADGLTVVTRGPWMLFFAGELFTIHGHGVFRIDAAGETIVSLRGHVVDLCPILAG